MKSFALIVLLGLVCFVTCARADCGDDSKSSEDGDVKQWFKNLGCKIQKSAGDLQESAKPWADKIGSSAKELGSTVAQKYDEIKHKLTDDSSASSTTPFPVANAPTEKVLLAPLSGDASAMGGVPAVAPAPAASTATAERMS